MSSNQGILVVNADTVLRGEVRNCRQADIMGYVDGKVAVDRLVVHQGGRCFGTIRAGQCDVQGTLQGTVVVKDLIHIHGTGSVNGSVRYGKMSMEAGGVLSAQVSNIPPSIAGDLELSVAKGGSVPIHLEDLQAVDPDDDASQLVFTITNPRNGFVAATDMPQHPVSHFTQAELASGRILFRHDGANESAASFDVIVADHTGATSGAPQTVHVSVRG